MAASSLISCMPQFVGDRYNIESVMSNNNAVLSRRVVLVNLAPGPKASSDDGLDSGPLSPIGDEPQQNAAVMIVSNLTAYLSGNDTLLLPGLANFSDGDELRRILQSWSKQMRVEKQQSGEFFMPSRPKQLHLAGAEGKDSNRNTAADNTKDFSVLLSNASSHQLCKPALMPEADWAAIKSYSKAELEENKNSGDDSFLYIFIAVGSVLKGMGHSPLHPLGMSFIDDFASGSNSAVYIGKYILYTQNDGPQRLKIFCGTNFLNTAR